MLAMARSSASAGTNGVLTTDRHAFASTAEVYTTPNGTSHVLNSATATVYDCTIKFPAVPVADQTLIISTLAYQLRNITLNGNGATVVGDAIISLMANTGATYRYNATSGWVPVENYPMVHSSADVKFVGYSFKAGVTGWKWQHDYTSAAFIVRFGSNQALGWLQATAGGMGNNNQLIEFWCENTIGVTDATAGNGQYSHSGFHATIYNSSIPFGVGATNDVPVEITTMVTCRNHAAGSFWTSSAAGAAAWLTYKNGPLYIGDRLLGQRAQFDVAGNFRTTYMCVDESVQRDTGTANFTVSDNTSTVILAGSGTVEVLFPATPVNGQPLTLSLETAYTAVTVNGNGKTVIAGAAIGVTAGSFASWRYHLATTTWHRVG